jgi:hypothetical protein
MGTLAQGILTLGVRLAQGVRALVPGIPRPGVLSPGVVRQAQLLGSNL